MSLAPVNTTLAHTIFHVPSMDIFPTKWRQIYRHLLLIQEQAESNQHPHFWPWGWAEWVTESSFLVESSIQLPSKAETWGLIATICLRAITLTKKMKSYKLLNRRNTRKTHFIGTVMTTCTSLLYYFVLKRKGRFNLWKVAVDMIFNFSCEDYE